MASTLAAVAKVLRVRGMTLAHLAINPSSLSHVFSDFAVFDDDQTLKHLDESGLGIVRFGNSELAYAVGHQVRTQDQFPQVRKRLRAVIAEYDKGWPAHSNFALGLPLDLTVGKDVYGRGSSLALWQGSPKYALLPMLRQGPRYSSAHCFRFHEVRTNLTLGQYKEKVFSIFQRGTVIYVGPTPPPEGLLKWDHFVQIPKSNAMRCYQQTLSAVEKLAKGRRLITVLITGGILGTIMSAELNRGGVRALDIGQTFRHATELSL